MVWQHEPANVHSVYYDYHQADHQSPINQPARDVRAGLWLFALRQSMFSLRPLLPCLLKISTYVCFGEIKTSTQTRMILLIYPSCSSCSHVSSYLFVFPLGYLFLLPSSVANGSVFALVTLVGVSLYRLIAFTINNLPGVLTTIYHTNYKQW